MNGKDETGNSVEGVFHELGAADGNRRRCDVGGGEERKVHIGDEMLLQQQ